MNIIENLLDINDLINVVQLDGTIVAPTSSSHWGSGLLQWLEFTKLVGLTIRGGGTIDGNGAVWWQNSPYDDDPLDDQSKLIFPSNGSLPQKHPIPVINLDNHLSFVCPRVVSFSSVLTCLFYL